MLRPLKVGLRCLIFLLLLSGWGLQELRADSTPELTQKLVSGRSARTIPHRFTIVPSGVSLAPNQTQHFGVTDAQGNPVAVHWNISGLHCAGMACGNIDADGNYTPPASLSRPLEITLEGVVVSDPNYSVMTRVEILVGAAPTPDSVPALGVQVSGVQVSETKPAPSAAPAENVAASPNYSIASNQRVNQPVAPPPALASAPARQSIPTPSPNVVAAAPKVEAHALTRSASLNSPAATKRSEEVVAPPPTLASAPARQSIQTPAPNVVAAAPKVETHAPAATTSLLPLPGVVAATPDVEPTSNSSHQQMPPVPDAVAAAPVVKGKRRHSDEGTILLDMPSNVSNLTVAKKPDSTPSSQATSSSIVAPTPAPVKTSDKVVAPATKSTAPQNQVADLRSLPSPASAPPAAKATVPTPAPAAQTSATPPIVQPQIVQPQIVQSQVGQPPIIQSPPIQSPPIQSPTIQSPTVQPTATVATATKATSTIVVTPKIETQPASASTPAVAKRDAPVQISAPVAASVTPTYVAPSSVAASSTPTNSVAPKLMASLTTTNTNPAILASLQTTSSATSVSSVRTGTTPSATLAVSSASATTSSPAPAGTVVTYRDGQLRIDAENTTLAEVLRLVAQKMGAVIEVPAGSGQERIVEHVGPGHPNDVLTQLLNGSHFNFIIVNSALRPNEPAEVLLSMQGTDTSAPVAAPMPTPAPTTSALWTPPDPTLHPMPLPPQYDSSLTVPANRESLTPDAISELMRAKAKELRERAMQQAGGMPPGGSQPPPPSPEPQQPPQQ